MEWIRATLWEIKHNTSLRFFGFLLGLYHMAYFFLWTKTPDSIFTKVDSQPLLCWSFWSECSSFMFFSPGQAKGLLITSLVFAVLSCLVFLSQQILAFGWILLTINFFIQVFFYLFDFSLFSNVLSLGLLLQFYFLFLPNKVPFLKWVIICYYLVLASVKWNGGWLSGYLLTPHISISSFKSLEWIAALITLVEFLAPLGLLSRKGRTFAIALGIMSLYNSMIWVIYGSMDTIMGFGFLVFYILCFRHDSLKEFDFGYQSYDRPEPTKIWIPVVLSAFLFLQFFPVLIPESTQTFLPFQLQTGSLPTECHSRSFLVMKRGMKEIESNSYTQDGPAPYCNTSRAQAKVRSFCRKYSTQPQFKNIASFFSRRKYSEPKFHRPFESLEACSESGTF